MILNTPILWPRFRGALCYQRSPAISGINIRSGCSVRLSQFETIAIQGDSAYERRLEQFKAMGGELFQDAEKHVPRGAGRSIAASRQVMAFRRDSSAVWNQESFLKRSR